MSAISRWIIAIFSLLGAVMVAKLPLGEEVTTQQRVTQWGVAGFCVLIAVACFPGRGRAVAVRIIGAAVFVACVGYIFDQWKLPVDLLHSQRSDPNIINAVVAFLTFGLPGGYVAVTGKFPRWTMLGEKLHKK